MPPEFITILNTAAGEELLVEDENEIPDPEDKRIGGDEADSNAPGPTKKQSLLTNRNYCYEV